MVLKVTFLGELIGWLGIPGGSPSLYELTSISTSGSADAGAVISCWSLFEVEFVSWSFLKYT